MHQLNGGTAPMSPATVACGHKKLVPDELSIGPFEWWDYYAVKAWTCVACQSGFCTTRAANKTLRAAGKALWTAPR